MFNIKVVNKSNKSVVWEMDYNDINEAMADIKVLMKPSAFGVSDYEITINKG